jgi:hypothetical protein
MSYAASSDQSWRFECSARSTHVLVKSGKVGVKVRARDSHLHHNLGGNGTWVVLFKIILKGMSITLVILGVSHMR